MQERPLILFLLILEVMLFAGEGMIPERRKPQFLDEQGYLVMPAPYSMPGIGRGMAYYGGANNYLGRTDMFAVRTTGDAEGTLLGLWDLHLVDKTAIVDFTYLNFSRTGINRYAERGMDSGKNDFSIAEADLYSALNIKFLLSFFDRRLEVITRYDQDAVRTTRLLDSDGKVLQEISDPTVRKSHQTDLSFLADLTDDRQDPRKGIRATLDAGRSLPRSDSDPEFYSLTWNVTGYVPVNDKSTIALNYLHSDALMLHEGERDRSIIARDEGFDCTGGCSQEALDVVENRYLYNTHGSARGLGGENALRSYSGGRFIGAHSRLVGAELRWNFSAERKPVDLYFIRDIRTGVQLALFHETGTVADSTADIWKDIRHSTGAGVRFIMGSGFVYRFDYATGSEGEELTIYVSYPWERL